MAQSKFSAAKTNIWKAILESLKGSDADYTKIGLNRAIFLLAVPMILELVMESTFAVVDIYFVGRLGPDAIATVGLTETYLYLLYSIAMGLSMALTAIVARRVGEGKKDEAGLTAFQAIVLSVLVSLPFSIAGVFYGEQLLILMGSDAQSAALNQGYTQWMLGANGVIVLLFNLNAVFRGAGDAAIAMKVLWIANGFNIILDPILIFGLGPIPAFGIEGAAIASTLGRSIGIMMQVYALAKGGKHIRVLSKDLKLNVAILLNIIKTSLGGVGQMIIAMTSWIFLMRILANIGSEAVAGATITIRVMMFTIMPAWGLSNAAATLVGQNLGANDPDRAENSVLKIGWYNMIFLILVSVVFFFFNKNLIGIFTTDQNVVDVGAEWLKIMSYSFFIYGWWMVSVQAFNGAGDTKTPTWINLIFFWIIQIPLAYFLAIHLNWNQSGVFWAVFISESSVGLFTFYMFRKGKWKTYKV
ncbi:MATE family efflux transporter [Hyphobacterium sp. CCMP332]|nr:MATE family efflux transporter [Hyphobacterium sp. CCMP332]